MIDTGKSLGCGRTRSTDRKADLGGDREIVVLAHADGGSRLGLDAAVGSRHVGCPSLAILTARRVCKTATARDFYQLRANASGIMRVTLPVSGRRKRGGLDLNPCIL